MAQTKLDLSDNKFEQLSTEILHLSGSTHLFGEFLLESGSTLSILPNVGAGKVLTSDGGGTATWQVSIGGGVTGATNGLGIINNTVCLGGNLNTNTVIDITTKNLCLCSGINLNRIIVLDQSNDELKLSWADSGNTCNGHASFNATNVSLVSQYAGGGCVAGILLAHSDNRICLNSAGSYRTYHNACGLWYTDNYSGSATDRWLTDKAYVDSHSGGGGITGGTNGLHIDGTNLQNLALGGCLCCATTIDIKCNTFLVCGAIGVCFIKITESSAPASTITLNSCCCTSVCGNCGVDIHANKNLSIGFNGTGIITDSTATPLGLQYASDAYRANFTNCSLVTKCYVDVQINSHSALSEFTITGDSTATGFTINHAKNKQFVAVEIVRGSSPYDTVYTSVQRPNANCVCIFFDTAPASGQQYKILITS
jgi:hypothetical protein